jgi:hypothetical protein
VIYQCSIPTLFCSGGTKTWASNTNGNTPGIFNVDPRDGYIHVWSINGAGEYVESAYYGYNKCGGNYLKLQNDGNLVLYRVGAPSETAAWAEWASNSYVGAPPACP